MTETKYCKNCEGEREIVRTVGWQSDVCGVCGNSIEY